MPNGGNDPSDPGVPWEPLRPNRQGGGDYRFASSGNRAGRRAPGFATSLSVKSGPRGAKTSQKARLDATAGAAASAAAVIAPWTAYRAGMTPGKADGSVNSTKRYWSSNQMTITSQAGTVSSQMRVNINPSLVGHMHEFKTFTAGLPAANNTYNAEEYATIAGEGVLLYRTVAMGVQVKNITDEATLEGATVLLQMPQNISGTSGGGNQTALSNFRPNYIGASNKPGVIMQAFWEPDADDNDYTAIAAAPGNGSTGVLSFSTTTITANPQIWFIQTFLLVECLGTGDGLHQVTPFIGDPTTFAETIGNNIARMPQFCMQRCFISDDVIETALGSGIEKLESYVPGLSEAVKAAGDVFDVDVVKEAAKWLKNGAKSVASRVGSWMSSLWGATGISPAEFAIAGKIVAMGEDNVELLQQLSASHPAPGELLQWATEVLGTQVKLNKGIFIDSPVIRGEIPRPLPFPSEEQYNLSALDYARAGYTDQDSKDDRLIHDMRLLAAERRRISTESTASRRHPSLNAVKEPPSPTNSFISVRSTHSLPKK